MAVTTTTPKIFHCRFNYEVTHRGRTYRSITVDEVGETMKEALSKGQKKCVTPWMYLDIMWELRKMHQTTTNLLRKCSYDERVAAKAFDDTRRRDRNFLHSCRREKETAS